VSKRKPLGAVTICFTCSDHKKSQMCQYCAWASCGGEACDVEVKFNKGVKRL